MRTRSDPPAAMQRMKTACRFWPSIGASRWLAFSRRATDPHCAAGSIEDALVILPVAGRRQDRDDVKLEAGASLGDDPVEPLRHQFVAWALEKDRERNPRRPEPRCMRFDGDQFELVRPADDRKQRSDVRFEIGGGQE